MQLTIFRESLKNTQGAFIRTSKTIKAFFLKGGKQDFRFCDSHELFTKLYIPPKIFYDPVFLFIFSLFTIEQSRVTIFSLTLKIAQV